MTRPQQDMSNRRSVSLTTRLAATRVLSSHQNKDQVQHKRTPHTKGAIRFLFSRPRTQEAASSEPRHMDAMPLHCTALHCTTTCTASHRPCVVPAAAAAHE